MGGLIGAHADANDIGSSRRPRLRRFAFGANPRTTAARAAILVVCSFVVFRFLLVPIRGRGPSMAPTLADGSLHFVNTLAYRWSDIRRGDIIAIRTSGRQAFHVKRVIALPGERVRIQEGVVFVDDRPLDEPYVKRRSRWMVPELRLRDDEFLVIGDNRGMRQANHDFGRARRKRIAGKILF